MSQPQPYLLTANTELVRLRLQSQTLEPEAEAFLDTLGIEPGWSCLDVACGAMGVLVPLARRAGPSGHVVGTDFEPKMLAAARAYLDEQQLAPDQYAPVELIQDDAYHSALPPASFDLTHVRFLFAPVGRGDELLPQLKRLTKPGGVIAAEEPEIASWAVYPSHPAWARLVGTIEQAFAAGGGDFNAGRRLYSMFVGAGLEAVRVRAGIVALPPGHPYLRGPILMAGSLRPRILSAGILSEDELEQSIAQVEAHVARPDVMGVNFAVLQVAGRLPAR